MSTVSEWVLKQHTIYVTIDAVSTYLQYMFTLRFENGPQLANLWLLCTVLLKRGYDQRDAYRC